ncbi:hypothetical protein JTE90_007943 [Oedothorax gibbosus]|uniref:heparosan-N-sulfate-glucuronate 5-epimerase n=1 Tax=Oedothorax gibbosus TaxID=931172 RepID=A0AAV6VKJ2_9ARAC|nr:hypothetical protein JTE90_007943 [Oedothorax gibbosus]
MTPHQSAKANAASLLLPTTVYSDQRDFPMRVRISLKLLLLVFTVVVVCTTLSYWSNCGVQQQHPPCGPPATHERTGVDLLEDGDDDMPQETRDENEIDCAINDEYTVPCKQDKGEVYVPFSFLRKYFEVYGKVVKHGSNGERFEWQHSYSKVYYPRQKYDPSKVFLWFENYNVEVRDRVKCISGSEGVPVSTQWDTRGHFYPIQIAQFGLSHFSKNLTDSPPTIVVLEDGEATQRADWQTGMGIRKVYDNVAESVVLEFKTEGENKETLSIDEGIEEVTLNCDLLFTNGSLTVVLNTATDPNTIYRIHYIASDSLIAIKDGNIFYGIGTSNQWKTLTRDLTIDLHKGWLQMKKGSAKPRNLRVYALELRGHGRIDNVSLSSSAHLAHFFAAANWLVNHQDDSGGWPNMVTRKLSNGMLELSPGWYSAMAQGQAMSLLTRAFKVTNDLHYLESALKAIQLFNVRSEHRGILTTFLGKYVWYEEYPTLPSSFVLNGFVYALFGLYDVQQSGSTHQLCREAGRLFQEGLVSLKKMLPLFDTGSGSVYDLRHFSLGTVPPNVARWDYHSTHVNQLLFLLTIHPDPTLKSVADRWAGYMKGKRAPHN